MRINKTLAQHTNKKSKEAGKFGQTQVRSGGVSLVATVFVAGSAVAALILASLSAPSLFPTAPSAPAPVLAVSPSPAVILLSALREVGLTPINLAAAGFSAEQVTGVLNAASAHFESRGESYRQGVAGVRATRQQVAELEALAQSGRATQDQLSSLASAKSNLAQVKASHADAQAGLLAAALDGVSAELRDTLATVRFHASWEVPAQYKVVGRSEADWVRLRDALAEARIAAASGQAPSETCTQFLAEADAHAAVANAKARLDAHAQAISDAWTSAVRAE